MTVPTIIYVTGMKPKPEPAIHREALLRVLRSGIVRADSSLADALDDEHLRFVLVSWTSLVYHVARDIALDLPGIDRLLAQPEPAPGDIREIDRPARILARVWHRFGDSWPWLTRLVASEQLRLTLAEVRRYLRNRGGIADRIREMVSAPLLDAWQDGSRVLLIGHSLGSVIAYDTLWELSRRARNPHRIDTFMSLGSPITTRFVWRRLMGSDRSGAERYPANIGSWLNVTARGELVALHSRLEPKFRSMTAYGLVASIEDREIYNHFRGSAGLDVHKSYGYLHHAAVAGAVARWLRSVR